MDLTSISALNAVDGLKGIGTTSSITGILPDKARQTEGGLFDTFLNSAIDTLKTTNSYLSDSEDEKIRFALGEVDNAHDLSIAMQKASAALQYTVAVRDKLLEAYRELMQMQI